MRIIYCDICGKADDNTLVAEVRNGQDYPGNEGSPCYRKIDICIPCLKTLDLHLDMELSDILKGNCRRK